MNSKSFVLTALLIAAAANLTAAQSGGDYTIKDATVEGSAHTSTGGNFISEVRLGQGLAGQPLSGGTFSASGGFFPAPPVMLPTTPPAAPTRLVVVAVSRTRVDLGWEDNSLNESGFIIERCNGNGRCTGWAVLPATGPDATTFSDATVQAGSAYQYRMLAFNAAGSSVYSNVVVAKTPKK